MKKQILIIDDDKELCELLQKLFTQNNYITFYSLNYTEAKQLAEYIKFDLMIIDYMMPEKNGIDVIKAFHTGKIYVPCLMLTAVTDINTTVLALTAGADDYITKPFNTQELLLRIDKIINRYKNYNGNNHTVIKIQDLVFDTNTQILLKNNTEIHLSEQERELCSIFFNNPDEIISKEDILQQLHKNITTHNIHAINISVVRLRKKLNENKQNEYIKTVRNKGFILQS